jgi:hypothetical protein
LDLRDAMTDASGSPALAHLQQAKLLAETARRLERPVDALPAGDLASVRLLLWQQAASCAVAAAQASAGDAEARLTLAAGGSELLTAVRELVELPARFEPGVEQTAAKRAQILASFTRSLLQGLDKPAQGSRWQRARLLAERFVLPGIVPLIGLLVLGFWLIRGPDLTASATRTLSSEASNCQTGSCGNATFHTNFEQSPWVRYDFGRPRQLHSISVENRTDCCSERALPLLVETSDDGKTWREQVRTDRPFYVFRHPLDVKARYLRLRVAAHTYLHLRSVSIR